jgi:hypothetical protein
MVATGRTIAAVVGVLAMAAPTLPGAAASTRSGAAGPETSLAAHAVHGRLPADGPPALYRPEHRLPRADGWPGHNWFPRVSGTRLSSACGTYWSDYLYDDHGARGTSSGSPVILAGTPGGGSYTYPEGPAKANGADIARAGMYVVDGRSYWRVDWNTLVDPALPMAEWVFDTDRDSATGVSDWGVGSNTSTDGIDTALTMSSHGARLIDLTTGKVRSYPVTVDRAAHSFVTRIPVRALPHRHRDWTVRLGAGLADGLGTGFASATGALPGRSNLYNVAFRTPEQERADLYTAGAGADTGNFWRDMAQADALAGTGPSAFALTWAPHSCSDKDRAGEHKPYKETVAGRWTDRWYVSAVQLGQGVLTSPDTIADGEPNFLGRVQPYSVYLPSDYNKHPDRRYPVTFLLHSLTQNHNQYAGTTPKFTKQACEDRGSICVTTLGRGPDGGYFDVAELDFWEVWREVATYYRTDANRTVISGYSMGGIGSNQLAMAHPDLFAKAVTLAGGVGDVAALRNLKWVPTYLAGGASDELVPVTTQQAEADALRDYGYRYRWVVYPGVDHVAFELADAFGDAAAYMGQASRMRHPRQFTYQWTPHQSPGLDESQVSDGGIQWTQRPDLGVRTTGAYWVKRLQARDRKVDARVTGISQLLHSSLGKATWSREPVVDGPGPGVAETQQVAVRRVSGTRHKVHLSLKNVRTVTLQLREAGFLRGQHGRLVIRTDGKVAVRIGGKVVRVNAGRHVVRFTA